MLNYNDINKLFNEDDDITTYLDTVYNLASFNSLQKMIERSQQCIINDLHDVSANPRTLRLLEHGHRSGFSYPLVFKDKAMA